jgi:signal transduction histidine kinase
VRTPPDPIVDCADEWSDEPAGDRAEPRGPGAVVLWTAVTGVGALTALTVWGELGPSARTALIWLDVVAGILSVALTPALLLARPVPVALVLAALAAVSPAATPAATLGTLQVARRRPLTVAIAVALVDVVAHIVRAWWRPGFDLGLGWWVLMVLLAQTALVAWGAFAQARQALLASLRARARRAEAEQARRIAEARSAERTRIAREMHDVLAHRLALVATHAGALEYRPDASPEQLARAAGVVRSGLHQAMQELRDVIEILRAPDDLGEDMDSAGASSLHPLPALRDVDRLVAESRAAGARITVRNEVADLDDIPDVAARTGYRVVREGLTNALKHAPRQPVELSLRGRPGSGLSIVISNPMPPAPGSAMPGSGTGLIGLAERVELAGGTLQTTPTATGRFRLSARLPWPP